MAGPPSGASSLAPLPLCESVRAPHFMSESFLTGRLKGAETAAPMVAPLAVVAQVWPPAVGEAASPKGREKDVVITKPSIGAVTKAFHASLTRLYNVIFLTQV